VKPVRWQEQVAFDETRAAKADLWRAERLFAGLNCLLPGQSQAVHAHAGADKFYLVLEGSGTFEVGAATFRSGAGALVPAPAGVAHGVRNEAAEPLVLLTVMAPPPGQS
jgi:mannose-6-phosphate isomerase-like protein (cupin superfamily)